jgi:hypothetical protein
LAQYVPKAPTGQRKAEEVKTRRRQDEGDEKE